LDTAKLEHQERIWRGAAGSLRLEHLNRNRCRMSMLGVLYPGAGVAYSAISGGMRL
jgi:hypothetical protein